MRDSPVLRVATAALLTLAVACVEPRQHHEPGQVTTAPPGTVALGAPCQGFVSCAAVAGKSVGCRCTDQASVPVCVADAELGDPCSGPGAFAPCRAGAICVASADAGTQGRCVALGKAGDPCRLGDGGCVDDTYCDDTGHCSPRTAALGAPCFGFDAWSCKSPNVCDSNAAVCVAPIATGGTCGSILAGRSACGDAAYCTLSIGERAGTCQPASADGDSCWVDEQCLSRICFQGVCGRGYPANAWVSCSL